VPLSQLVVAAPTPSSSAAAASNEEALLPPRLPTGSSSGATAATAAATVATTAVHSVTAALHSVNLFVRPVVVSDAAVVARGRLKTWVFAVCFVVTVLALLIVNLVQEATVQRTVLWPSASEYAAMAEYAPVCGCSVQNTQLHDVGTLNLPPEANFSLNAASALMQLYDLCGSVLPTPGNTSLGRCVGTDAGALAWVAYLQPLAIVSYSFARHFAEYTAATLALPVGASLMAPAALEAYVQDAVLQQMRLFWLLASQGLQGITAVATLSVPPAYELTAGARVTYPPGCTCAASVGNPSPAAQANNQCFFQPAFDSRPTSNYTATWVCNTPVSLVFFPMELLLLNATYEALALPPPYTQFMNFSGAAAFSDTSGVNSTGFNAFVFQSVAAIFPLDQASVPMPVSLTPGFLDVNFDAHYATCRPSSCTYVHTARPTAATAATAVLGVISGAQTVLMLLVDRGVDFVCARRDRRRKAGEDDNAAPA